MKRAQGARLFSATAPDITTSATTETNIETAIDTLANLTFIHTFTVTLADAGVDAVLGMSRRMFIKT